MPGFKRRRLLIDPKVQGSLLLRTVMYWALCLISITIMLVCWRILTGPSRMFYTHFDGLWQQFGPAAIASLFLLPIVLIDSLRMSNRFAGPVYRLRRAMRSLAAGEHVSPVRFRDDDFWQDFADDFNRVCSRVDDLQVELFEAQVYAAQAADEEIVALDTVPQHELSTAE